MLTKVNRKIDSFVLLLESENVKNVPTFPCSINLWNSETGIPLVIAGRWEASFIVFIGALFQWWKLMREYLF